MIVDDRNKIILYHVRMLKIAKIGNVRHVPGLMSIEKVGRILDPCHRIFLRVNLP